MTEAYLFAVGWLFLAAWGAIVVAVSVKAFGRDLLDGRAPFDPGQATRLTDCVRPTEPTPRQSPHGI